MSDAAWLNLAMGLVAVASAVVLWLLEILMDPERPNYPSARRWMRLAMFIASCAFIYRGGEFIRGAFAAEPPPVTSGMLMAWPVMLVVFIGQLEHQVRMWLPARLQEKIRRLLEIASCGRSREMARARATANGALRAGVEPGPVQTHGVGPALAELALQGVPVIDGRGGAQAIVDSARADGP